MSPFDDTLVEGLPPASVDDKEMALAFQRGDDRAYQAIHERYEERVHRVCRRMLGKREDAQEAAQETFLRVYTALGKFNGRYQLGAWITRIATNVCLDQIRARSRRPVEATPIEDLEIDLLASSADSDPEAVTVRNAESRRVRKVLLGLPPMHRAAIVLRDFEGLSYAEVGVALGMTECQVKALIHRARKGFRRSWTPLVEMLVPAKLLQRFRDVDVSTKEHVVNAAASQSAPVVSVCSGLLQQCGSFVVDRVVPFTAAVVLGGTSAFAGTGGGGAPAPAPAPASSPEARAEAPTSQGRAPSEAPRVAGGDQPVDSTESPAPTTTPTTAPATTPPASPAPSPAPTASPATANPTPPEGTMTPKATPAPRPFLPELYFRQGQTPTARAPESNTVRVDCATRTVDQSMRAEISDHEGSYPIDIRLKTSGSTLEATFTVHKKGFAVAYSGTGVLVGQSNTGNELYLSFNGRYGSGGTAAESAGLPVNGSITVDLGLDCTAQSLIAESVVLTTQ